MPRSMAVALSCIVVIPRQACTCVLRYLHTRHVGSPDSLVLDQHHLQQTRCCGPGPAYLEVLQCCSAVGRPRAARQPGSLLDRPSATTDPTNRARAVYSLAQVRASIYGREISHRPRLAADRSPVDRRGQAGRNKQAAVNLVLRRPRRLSLTSQQV